MVLGYLISPVVQIVDSHGKPIVGAKIYVYKAGTTNTVNTYRDFSNHYNSTPVLTDTLGNCTIIAPDDMVYDIVVKDNRNNLLMSKDNLTVSSGINPDINLRFREGYGIIIRKNGNTVTIAIDTDVVATKDDLATKQDKLTAGDNIDITNNNIINVVNRKTLYTQWPLKVDRGSSMVKLYLDQDFVDNTTEILPGADLTASYDEFGHKIIGVDTNSSATGDYNFYAGYDNEISGNYSTVFGRGNTVSGDYNTIIGKYANQGDYLFAVGNGSNNTHRSNVFEVRKNNDIYFEYNNEMHQLKPLVSNVFYKLFTISHVITNDDITNYGFSETLDFSQYNTWLSTGLLTSIPMTKVEVFMFPSEAVDTDIFVSRQNTYGTSWNTPWIHVGKLSDTQFLETEYTENDPTVTRRYIEVTWSNRETNLPAVGSTVYIHYSIKAIKLV